MQDSFSSSARRAFSTFWVRELGEHMLFVILEMVYGNAAYPGGEGALTFEGGQMGHNLQKDVLGRILRVMERAQHPQGQIEYQILHTRQYRLQRGLIAGCGLSDQRRQLLLFFCVHKNTS